MHKNKICVPNSKELINLVLKEMHNFPYDGHPSYEKMIATIRNKYF
jgi:hypothetical protein